MGSEFCKKNKRFLFLATLNVGCNDFCNVSIYPRTHMHPKCTYTIYPYKSKFTNAQYSLLYFGVKWIVYIVCG